MSVTIRLRRGTAAQWTSQNPTLKLGEPGLETDTGKIKYGDGTTAWTSLAYFLGNVANVDTTNPANITQDSTHRFVTDTEKSTWNGKQDALGFTPENTANKNQNNGYAGLDAGGKISASLLPSTVMEYKGGYRTVANNSERDAITSDRRKLGMIVYSIAEDKYYTLKTGLTNSDWIVTYYKPIVSLVDAATITPDFKEGYNFSVTIEGNRLFDNPTNLEEGQSGLIYITQGTGGNKIPSFGNKYAFTNKVVPTFSTVAGSVDLIVYYVKDTNTIICNVLLNVGIPS